MSPSSQANIVECISPCALMFLGGGAIIAVGGKDLVAIAHAHGLGIGVVIVAAGHISGGVYSPAITVGLWTAGKLAAARSIGYMSPSVSARRSQRSFSSCRSRRRLPTPSSSACRRSDRALALGKA